MLCWPNKRLWAERDQPLTTTTFIWPTDIRVCNAFELSQISDEKERMLYANVAAEKLLGFSREDKDAGLWDEGDESGGNGDSATVVSGRASQCLDQEGVYCGEKSGECLNAGGSHKTKKP